MMNSKERAEWRAKANGIEALFQVGKGGVSDELIRQVSDALKKRELIKLKVLLESSPETPREAAEKIAAATDSEVVQVVGGSMVFYKENPLLHQPAKKPAKQGKPLSRVKAKRAAEAKRNARAQDTKKRFKHVAKTASRSKNAK